MDRVLIVDDDKSIRWTISQAISSLPIEVDAAEDGAQALAKIDEGNVTLILLDLQMPGLNGMDVLRRLRDDRPEIPVIIITARGSIESAVEAMKLGAIEFLPKPFVPDEIRSLISRVLERNKLAVNDAHDYKSYFELAKRCMAERHFDAAVNHLKHAIGIDPKRPEAFNLLGVINELQGQRTEAMNNYRVAYHTDPSYKPANDNLDRSNGIDRHLRPINIGELREPKIRR